ncbi:hypothetical protein ABID21_003500 [Pseudorhizobium tarimense]|uniref:Uncharacterized protein n=1 Tax=Pseudorhizobium tarimense TaxID=1079109 RepID=A0ABV2HA00_9HYPH
MPIPWKDRLIDLLSVPYSLFWFRREKTVPTDPQVSDKPYQRPLKGESHPGDEAAVRASTETSEGAKVKH